MPTSRHGASVLPTQKPELIAELLRTVLLQQRLNAELVSTYETVHIRANTKPESSRRLRHPLHLPVLLIRNYSKYLIRLLLCQGKIKQNSGLQGERNCSFESGSQKICKGASCLCCIGLDMSTGGGIQVGMAYLPPWSICILATQ